MSYKKVINQNYNHGLFNSFITKYGAKPIQPPNISLDVKPENSLHRGNVKLYSSGVGSLSPLDENLKVHSGMVPFFGGSSKQNVSIENREYADKLDTYTGNFRLNQQHKKEIGTLFTPAPQNLTSSQAPRPLDLFAKSCTIRNGEKPFEQIRVARGLDEGYTDKGSGGFHNPIRIVPLNSEQMYVNPKTSFEGKINAGADSVQKGPVKPNLYIYKQHVLVDNECGQRNFVTNGEVIAPKIYSDVVLKDTNRKNITFTGNHAKDQGPDKHLPCDMIAKNKTSTKANLDNTPFRSLFAKESLKIPEAKHSYKVYDNERNQAQVKYTESGRQHGNVDVLNGKTSIYNLTPAPETIKQNLLHSPMNHINSNTHKGKTFDPLSVPDVTLRELIENATSEGNLRSTLKGKAFDPLNVPDVTLRELIENATSEGNLKSILKGKTFDPLSVPDVTLRELIEIATSEGTLRGTLKGKAFDPLCVPPETLRELIENSASKGMIKSTLKGKAFDPLSVPAETLRELIENSSSKGMIKSTLKGKAFDPLCIPAETLRELIENSSSNGMIGSTLKGKTFDPLSVPDVTLRELIENATSEGNLRSTLKGKAFDPLNVPDVTLRELIENTTSNGMIKSSLKGKAFDPLSVPAKTLRELIENTTSNGIIKSSLKGKAFDPLDIPSETLRELIENSSSNGNLKSSLKGKAFDPLDIPSGTLRELIENSSSNGMLGNTLKGKAFDPLDIPLGTLRELIENSSSNGMLGNTLKGKAFDPLSVPDVTLRELIENSSSKGMIKSTLKGKAFDPLSVPDVTLRELIENSSSKGMIGNILKGKTFDPLDVPAETLRELIENSSSTGMIGNILKGKVFDPLSIPDVTLRELMENYKYIAPLKAMVPKNKAHDPTDIAKLTQRINTEKQKYLSGPNSSTLQNGGGYETAPTDTSNTHRQDYSDYYYVKPSGPAEGQYKPRIYDDSYNIRQNLNAERVSVGREPTKTSVKVPNGMDTVNLETKKLDGDRENKYGLLRSAIITSARKPMNKCEITKTKNTLPSFNPRFDPDILEAFNKNGLTHSLNSWA